MPLRVRSMVGLIPLFAVEVLDGSVFARLPEFSARGCIGFSSHRPELARLVSRWHDPSAGERHLLSLLRGHRMKRLLRRMLDETEFLSDYGVRSLSKYHEKHPYVFEHAGNADQRRLCARRVRDLGVSAAIPTGAARSGCRSIIC